MTKAPEASLARRWYELAARAGLAMYYGALILFGAAVSAAGGAIAAVIPGAIGCNGLGFCGEWTGWMIYAGAIIGGCLGTNHAAKIIEGFRRTDRLPQEMGTNQDWAETTDDCERANGRGRIVSVPNSCGRL